MKKYTKPSMELVEVSVKENIAALPSAAASVDYAEGTTTYTLNSYLGEGIVS